MRMVRFFLFFGWLALLLACFNIASAADNLPPLDLAKLKSGEQTLNVGHYEQLPPFYYAKDSNEQRGFGYDIFTEVAKKTGVQKVNFMEFNSLANLSAELKQGKIDVIANSWDLPGMRKQFSLTLPYYTKGGLSLLYFKQKGNFQAVEDLKDHNIGVFKTGYAYNYWLPAHGISKHTIKTYNTIRELMTALKNDNIDVAVIYYPLARLAQKQSDQLATTLIQPINDVYAVRMQDTALKDALNQAITELRSDGTIDRIQKAYLDPADVDANVDAKPPQVESST